MRPGTARRIGGFVVGVVVAGLVVGLTVVMVNAGRDLNRFRGQSCPVPPIDGPGLTRIPVGGPVISAAGANGSLWVLRRTSDAAGPSLVRVDTRTSQVGTIVIPLP